MFPCFCACQQQTHAYTRIEYKTIRYREYVPFKRNYVKTKRLEAGILIKIKMIK